MINLLPRQITVTFGNSKRGPEIDHGGHLLMAWNGLTIDAAFETDTMVRGTYGMQRAPVTPYGVMEQIPHAVNLTQQSLQGTLEGLAAANRYAQTYRDTLYWLHSLEFRKSEGKWEFCDDRNKFVRDAHSLELIPEELLTPEQNLCRAAAQKFEPVMTVIWFKEVVDHYRMRAATIAEITNALQPLCTYVEQYRAPPKRYGHRGRKV